MKRKLFFITFLMLFCSTVFGQHWTMTQAEIDSYNSTMIIHADISINGESVNNPDVEIAAFHNGVLRGVAKPSYEALNGKYVATLYVKSNNDNELITFKVYDPFVGDNGEEFDTDYTVKFENKTIGLLLNPQPINFIKKHWPFNPGNVTNYMGFAFMVKINGVQDNSTDFELAAFDNNGNLCGVASPKLVEGTDVSVVSIKIYSSNNTTITFKLYGTEYGELETDYTVSYDENYDIGENAVPTIEFKNDPVARIGAEGNTARYFSSLEAAVAAAVEGEIVVLLKDVELTEKITISKNITIDLNDKKVTLSTGGNAISANVTIKNGNIDIADVDTQTTANSNCFISTNVGASLTLDDIVMTGDDYTTHWAVLCAMSGDSADKGSTINITNSTITLSDEKGSAGGFIKDQSGVDNYSQVNISNSTLTLNNVSRGFVGAKVTLNKVDLTITGGEHGINGSELVISNGSNVSISNGTGRAITLNKFDASVAGSTVTIANMKEGGIRYKTDNTLTVDASSKLSETTAYADVEGAKLNDKAVKGTETQMSTVKVENGVTTVINPASGQIAYRAYVNDSENREAVQVDLLNINAILSLVVKLYDANGNLLTTTTLKAGGVEAANYTCNIVLWGNASSSWETVINAEKLTVDNVPAKIELVVDGKVIHTFENALGTGTNVDQTANYKALDCVYKAAKIVNTYYGTLAAAVVAAQAGDEIVLLDNVSDVDVTISKNVTLDLNGKTINDAYIKIASVVTIKNGSIKNVNEPYPLVVNSGTLTVEGVAIEASKSDRAIWVRNGGDLVFNSGSILATKGEGNNKTSLIAAIYTDSNTDVTINGGTITVDTPDNKAVAIYGNYNNANVTFKGDKISTSGKNYSYGIHVDGDITVTGGEIVTNEKGYGYSSGIRYGNNYALVSALGNVTISGGTITTNGYSGYAVNVGRSYNSNDQIVSITGGTFTNNLSEVEMTTGGHKAPVLVWEGSASTVTATIKDGNFSGYNENLLRKDNENTTLAVSGGTFDIEIKEELIAPGFMLKANEDGTYGVVEDPDYGMVAKIGETRYKTLAAAFAAAAQTEELTTIQLLPVTIEEDDDTNTEEKTIKLPATIKNVIVKGAENNTSILKNLTIQSAQGGTYDMSNITFYGVVFDNSNIVLTGWRTGFESLKNLTVKNCTFKNIVRRNINLAAVHINVAADKAVNGFTFTNNVIDGVTGAQNSGIYGQFTGEVIVIDNTINNVAFRPYVIQLTTDDGIADNFTVTGNTFSGSAAGRAQGLGNNAEGTDAVALTVSNNIFKGITESQQICYCNFNAKKTTATLEKNYYDIDITANPNRIYYNSAASSVADLDNMGIYPIYTKLNENGTINTESLFDPVAYNGTVAYETLADAFAGQDGTIVLLENIELTEGVVVAADKTFTLDLNGKVVSMEDASSATAALIKNNGNLTIDDSSVEKTGKLTFKTSNPSANNAYASNTISNYGTITIKAGLVENTSVGGACYALDNYAGSTATIGGGKLTAEKTTVRIFNWTNGEDSKATLNVNDGEIYSNDGYGININSGNTPYVDLNINGGEITTDDTDYKLAVYVINNNSAENLNVTITNGTFNGNVAINEVATQTMKEDAVKVSGGTFNGEYGIFSYADDEVAVSVISIVGGIFATDYSEVYAYDDGYEFVKDETTGTYSLQQLNGFSISNLHELIAFRNAVNAGNTFAGQTVVLKNDIDLGATRSTEVTANWEPTGTKTAPFMGTFDGDDKVIKNMVVVGEAYQGFFGYADNATIKNVKIENATVIGTDCVGAIAGNVYSTSLIDNCHVSGSIKIEGQTNVGGIVGKYYTKVTNCSVIGDGVSTSYVKGVYKAANYEGDNIGGIMGHAGENNTHSGNKVKDITISGTRKVGGLIGVTDQNTDITNCLVENVNIETTATADYATANKAKAGHASIVGSYTKLGTNNNGTVNNCVVKNVNFLNPNTVEVSFGPITGGAREGMIEPTGVTASGNLIYMSSITGEMDNYYLMDAVAKIGETNYYTLQDAVDAAKTEVTTIDVIVATAETINVQDGANITINNINLTGSILAPNASLTISDGSIVNNNTNVSALEINAGKLALNNVNISSARHAVRIDGAVEATIEGGNYTLIPVAGKTQHAVNVSGTANVTIKAGTFVGPKGTAADSGAAVNVQAGSTVTIEGGDFSGGKANTLASKGTLTVKGGTFDQEVKAEYLADGYVCQKNAEDKYEVFFAVAKIGEVNYSSLQCAFNAVKENETITIISNVEESEVILPVALNNITVTALENVIVKNTIIKTPEMENTSGFAIAYDGLTFYNVTFENSRVHLKGWPNDALNQSVSIKNLVVTKCEFNNIANGDNDNNNNAALHLNVADGILENLTFTNNKVNGITGGESAALYGNFTGNVTITNNVIRNTSGSSMVVGYSNATVKITGNILENWAGSNSGRAIRLSENSAANASTIEVSGNAMIHANAPEEFVKSTYSNTTLTLDENYWNGQSPRNEGMVTADGVVIANYYKTCSTTNDNLVLSDLVVYAKGTITPGYVNTSRIWGEGTSNSQESFIVKVYAGETLLGQASLNDHGNIIDGDVYVTWGLPYNAVDTEYWDVEWFEALSPTVEPTTVKLYVDGELVAENVVKMSAPDDLNPIEWKDIFVAQVEETEIYFTSLQAAIDAATAGQTVKVIENITLAQTVTVAAGKDVILDLNGKQVCYTSSVVGEDMITNKGKLTIVDNSENPGKLSYNNTDATGSNVTVNTISTEPGSTLVVNGGTIENKTVKADGSSIYSYAIDILTNGNLGDVNVTITGGKVYSDYMAIRQFNNGEVCKNSLTINGGYIYGAKRAVQVHLKNNAAYTTIVGGKIEGGDYSLCFLATSVNLSVSGGEFIGAVWYSGEEGFITGGTFNTDVNKHCHEYYDAITEDNITWKVEQVLFAQTTALQGGWNWYSSYINLSSDEELEEMQNAFDGKGLEIKGKTGFSDYQYIGDDENGVAQYKWYKSDEDFSISAKQMYMIKTTEALDLVVDGKVVNPATTPISLKVGWNWIGYPMTENVAINVALANLEAEQGDVIKSRNGESEYIDGYGWDGDILTMEPGIGYKYYSQKITTFVYNSTTDNSRYVNENVTPNNNYWLPEVSQYANNMSIVAMLNIDGEIAIDNYEIAAFVNGECRGSARPVYIEALDVYMVFMMVYGEESEELSFKYYDVNYETEYELDDVITYYSDSRIGSVNNPYMFNLNILNIEETSIDQISIYPNPTTTNSEINLQAMCDKVEVFNALGVKVAEYSNVDSIDALETAGVYVIRVTIDGNTRNCRLVVK